MAFSADSIGFYLQCEDQLTPTLETAADAYKKFVGQLEKWNKKAYQSAGSSFDKLSALAEVFERLPQQAARSYSDALDRMRKRAKPFAQPINIVFSPASKKEIATAISAAVTKSVSGFRLRLSPTMPKGRLGYFDSSASLMTLYRSLAQPPDMKGKLEPKKFKKGGMVEGGTPGKDSVLALLEPGEFVIPADVVKQLGALQNIKGKFVSPKSISESIANIENLSLSLGKLKVTLDAGLGSPEMQKLYEKGLSDIQREMSSLSEATKELSDRSRTKLAPTIVRLTDNLKQFENQAKEAQDPLNLLLGKIIGPARWLAISTAMQATLDKLREFKDSVQSGFEELGGDQLQSFTENVNQLNQKLNLSRDSFIEFKSAARSVASDKGLNVNEFSESLEGLANAGVRSQEMLFDLAPAVTQFSRASGVGFDAAGQMAYRLADSYKLSADEISAVFNDLRIAQTSFNADAGKLTSDLESTLQTLGPALLTMSDDARTQTLRSLTGMSAAMQSTWGDATGEIMSLIGEAAAGTPEAMQQVAAVFGMSIDDLMGQLQSGDMVGIFDQLGKTVSSMPLDQLESLRTAINFPGTVEQLAKLGTQTETLNAQFTDFANKQQAVAGSYEALKQGAESTLRPIDKLRNYVADLASAQIPLLDTSIGDMIDGLQEIGAQSILATAQLAKMGVSGILSTSKAIKGWLGTARSATEAVQTVTSATTSVAGAAGAAGGAAATGGFFASLASGIAALGAVLLSPPGIAFSVTLVAVILSLGAALWMAEGAIKAFAPVMIAAINGMVEAFGLFIPVLIEVVKTIGTVFVEAIQGVVEIFTTLVNADFSSLVLAGPALTMMAVGLGSLATAVVAYGAAMLTASAGVAAFRLASGFGGAGGSGGIVGFVESLLGSMGGLQATAADQITSMTETINRMVPFLDAYAALAQRVQELPGNGLFDNLFGDNPAEKFREQALPMIRAISDVAGQANQATELRQPKVSTAVTPAQVQSAIEAVLSNPSMEEMRAAAQQTNVLLAQILQTLVGTKNENKTQQAPQTVARPTNPGVSPMTRSIASFGS